jgi:hypothetical protein
MPPSDAASYTDPFGDLADPGVPVPPPAGGFAGPGRDDAFPGGDPFTDDPFGGVPPAGGTAYRDTGNPFATD